MLRPLMLSMVILLVAGSALVMVVPALAGMVGYVSITDYSIGCTASTVSYISDNPSINDFADVMVQNVTTGDTVVFQLASPWDETDLVITYPAQPSGSELKIVVDNGAAGDETPLVMVIACEGLESFVRANVPQCVDGRLNFYHCDQVAIYPIADEGSYGLEVWLADTGSVGRFAFSVFAADLNALPDKPAETLIITASNDGYATLYKLTTGEYQVNVGPDEEGKVFVFTFDGLPPTQYPTFTTFMVS